MDRAILTGFTACALLLPLIACSGSEDRGRRDTVGDRERTAMEDESQDRQLPLEELCTVALTAKGDEYLTIETQLREAGPASVAALEGMDAKADPLAETLQSVLREWIEDQPADYQAALDYLEYLPQRIERTPLPKPPPSGVAAYLTQHFEGRVTRLLALRLVKAVGWPHWKVVGVLLYLEQQRDPETTAALLRFVAETADETWRSHAKSALAAIGDKELKTKAAAEREYYEDRGIAPPLEIVNIEASAGSK